MSSNNTTKKQRKDKRDIRNFTSYSITEISNEVNEIIKILTKEQNDWKKEVLFYEVVVNNNDNEATSTITKKEESFNKNKFPYCNNNLQDLVIEDDNEMAEIRSIYNTLVPTHRKEQNNMQAPTDPSSAFLDKWESELLKDLSKSGINVCNISTIIPSIPSINILFQLLRYATSDICLDYVLGRAILLLLWECRSLYCPNYGKYILRRLLVILKHNYEYNCRGTCEEEMAEAMLMLDNGNDDDSHDSMPHGISNHCCSDVKAFYNTLSLVLFTAIPNDECNLTLTSFVMLEYRRQFQIAGLTNDHNLNNNDDVTDVINNNDDVTDENNNKKQITKQQIWIKNKIMNMRYEYSDSSSDDSDDDSDDDSSGPSLITRNEIMCTKIIIAIIQSRRMRSSSSNIRTLSDITTLSIRLLPSNPLTQSIGSALITSFLSIFAPTMHTNNNNKRPTAMHFTRYVDILLHPPSKTKMTKDVYLIIRSLYYLDLIDISECKCGYGDFLVWTGYIDGIKPFERLLYIHEDNFILNANEKHFLHESTNDILIEAQANARYDLSLLLLIQFWLLPWTTRTHLTFTKCYQKCTMSLLLSLNRYHNLPKDIIINHIISFIPRDHYSQDESLLCWHTECQLRFANNKKNISSATIPQCIRTTTNSNNNSSPNTIYFCNRCGIMPYCNETHYKELCKNHHKRLCSLPPFRTPTVDEELLCQSLIEIDDTLKPTLTTLFPRIDNITTTISTSTSTDALFNEEDKMNVTDDQLDDDDDDDDWDDDEHKEAWTIAYDVLSKAMIDAAEATKPPPAQIAVIGCGWWSQGWHLPHLAANAPRIKIAAIVDASKNPVSTLSSSPLLSISDLSEKYDCPCFNSVSELLADPIGPKLDGVIVSTSHASHFDVGMSLLNEGIYRRQIDGKVHRALSILMEKPMTTDVDEARRLWEMSTTKYPEAAFIINHTASYRPQTQVARQIIASRQIGKIRHISASMNGPLMWLFDDPKNHSWVSKTPWKNKGVVSSQSKEEENTDDADEKADMDGNGYAWGQIAHTLAWIYQVIGADEDVAAPKEVYCTMTHAPKTGADIALAAVITCHDGVIFSLTGTALLPGSEYADPPVGKHIRVEVFGDDGCLMYGGNDRIPESGRLEVRKTAPGTPEDGQSEYPCSANRDWSEELGADTASELKDGFYFEDGEPGGKGPGSMKAFLDSCTASSLQYFEGKDLSSCPMVNDSLIGLRTVQIIHCMYRSSISGRAEKIDEEEEVQRHASGAVGVY